MARRLAPGGNIREDTTLSKLSFTFREQLSPIPVGTHTEGEEEREGREGMEGREEEGGGGRREEREGRRERERERE